MSEGVAIGGLKALARPIHIMHVVRRGFAGGGMENGIVNVTNRLPAERFRVSICALDSAETFSQRIPRSDARFYVLPKRGHGIDWSLVWKLAKLLRNSRIDIIHSHNWGTFLYAVLAAKIARVRIIHGEHGKNEGELGNESSPKRWTKSFLGRRVDALVTVSQEFAKEWAGYGVPTKKIQWIPNGVDVDRFRPRKDRVECRQIFGLPEKGILIGSIGRLDSLKNYDVLIAAFAKLAKEFADLNLALLGQGPNEESLRKLAEELGVSPRISMVGHRPNPEDFLAAIDIFALPSRFEGMSNVVLEAMASGLPVVCTDLPCHREVFSPGLEGIVVSPCTADTMAEALRSLCNNSQRHKSLGSAARSKVLTQFSIDGMVSKYERIYTETFPAGAVADFPVRH